MGATGPTGTFSGAHQVLLGSRWGQIGLLPSKLLIDYWRFDWLDRFFKVLLKVLLVLESTNGNTVSGEGLSWLIYDNFVVSSSILAAEIALQKPVIQLC